MIRFVFETTYSHGEKKVHSVTFLEFHIKHEMHTVDWCVFYMFCCDIRLPSLVQSLNVIQMSSHLTIDTLVQRGVHSRLTDSKVLKSCGCKTSYSKIITLVLGSCAYVPCLVFSKHDALLYGQTSPLWSYLSK